jgi:hypothetical protein
VSIQDHDGGGPLLETSRRFFPFIERAFADAGYDHQRVTMATTIIVEIVRKLPDQGGLLSCHAAGWSSDSSPGSNATEVRGVANGPYVGCGPLHSILSQVCHAA